MAVTSKRLETIYSTNVLIITDKCSEIQYSGYFLIKSLVRGNGSTHFRGGFASFNRQFIEAIPICIPTKSGELKTVLHIVELVGRMTATRHKLIEKQLSDSERERLERESESYARRIDDLVCELYGVNEIPE